MTVQRQFDFEMLPERDEAIASAGGAPPPGIVRERAAADPLPPRRLLFKPEEAAAMLGVGRTTLYELLAAGAIESVHIGSSRRVPLTALEDYVAGLRDMPGGSTHAHARRAARQSRRPQRGEHPVAPLRPVGDPQPTTAKEQGA